MRTNLFLLICIFSFTQAFSQISDEPAFTLKKEDHRVLSLAVSPDNKWLASGGTDNEVVIWNLKKKNKYRSLSGHESSVKELAFSHDSKYLLSGGKDSKAILWNFKQGLMKQNFKGHEDAITDVAIDPSDSKVVTASRDKSMRIWDIETGNQLKSFHKHSKAISAIAFNDDFSRIYSAGTDLKLNIWQNNPVKLIKSYPTKNSWVNDMKFSYNGKYIAMGGRKRQIRIWDAKTNRFVKTFTGHRGAITAIDVSGDNQYVASGAEDKHVKIWDYKKGEEKFDFKPHNQNITDIIFTYDGKYLVTSSLSETIKIWSLKNLNIKPLDYEEKVKGIIEDKSDGEELASSRGDSKNKGSKGKVTYSETSDLNFDPSSSQGENYLYIIAINDYKYWPRLNNAVKDAHDVRDVLTKYYQFKDENVKEIKNQEATIEGIYQGFKELSKKLGPHDNLLIYFSGHGYYDKQFEEGYWIPVDAKKGKETQYLPNASLLKYIKAFKTKHVFLVADACFSGSLFAQGSRGYVEKVNKYDSRWGLTSGRLEYVSDGSTGKNSPFAKYFIKYLKENRDKPFPVSELVQYVKVAVSNNSEQTPIGNPLKNVGDEGGEFVFFPNK